ncbi:MAG: hypothetical protein L0Y72_14515 [Gemmataceae bacterium]|nr:hypothetical protein [Gemmataceae bacterium]MCI0740257.1 hypothetical protein [Gemmataceae bacterium]
MAGQFAGGVKRTDYCGVSSIFEYTNDDGTLCNTNCGQAAAATFLTYHGKFAPLAGDAAQVMRRLEKCFPPDNLFGLFGTSRRCVERICKAHGVSVQPIAGRAALCARLRRGQPVIVMLGVSGGNFWNWDLPGGHWMVACGFDAEHVYLTNWGHMTWQEFEAGWQKLVPRMINMHGKGLAASSNP